MFRKRTKKAGQNLRRKRTSDKDEDDENDAAATGIAIRNTMKKQKILASLPLTSGGAAPKSKSEEPADPEKSTAELSVLAKKHVSNMEAYIEEKMAEGKTVQSSSKEKDEATNQEIHSEEDLYRQLAREVTADASSNTPQEPSQEDDGGAALLVGTGIAEVILPATAHKPVVSTTTRVYNKNSNLLSSAVPEAERHKHVLSSTTPKPFVKFRNNNNNNITNTTGSNPSNESKHAEQTEDTASSTTTERQGFDAFRGKAPAATNNDDDNNHSQQKSNRWKTGKDRDDQVYSHFLKNALNGKRR